jgi:hypothetical protein
MTLEGIWNVEWPNVNAQRKYPFSQDATLKAGDFTIPNDFIVDFLLPVNTAVIPTIDPSAFHVSQLGVFSNGVTVTFAYNGVAFATLSIPVASFDGYGVHIVQGTGAFFDSQGWVTLGSLTNVMKYPGAWSFDEDSGRLHPMTIRPDLRSVASVTVVNGDDISAPVTGDLALIAGANFRFRVDTSGAKPQIIFDGISGDGLEEDCECEELDTDAPCIRRISGVTPNAAGDIQLLGSTCVAITAGQHQLLIDDECSEPCCDCRELIVVTNTLDQMLNQMLTLEAVGQKLDEVLTATRVNLMASKTTGLPRVF